MIGLMSADVHEAYFGLMSITLGATILVGYLILFIIWRGSSRRSHFHSSENFIFRDLVYFVIHVPASV